MSITTLKNHFTKRSLQWYICIVILLKALITSGIYIYAITVQIHDDQLMIEMAYNGCRELMKRKVITRKVWVGIGYSKNRHESTAASMKLFSATALPSKLKPAVEMAFEKAAVPNIPIRRLALCFGDVCDEGCEGYDLFTDWNSLEREKSRERAVLDITQKYGKNAVLRGVNYFEGATQRERNEMIGGHRAGYDDPRTAR